MARNIAQTDWLSLRVWVSFGSQAMVTTFDYIIDPTTFTAGMTDAQLVQEFDGLAAPIIKPMIPSTAVYHGTQLTYLNVRPLPATESYNGNNGAGTAAAPGMPTQCRGLTKRLTAFAGPRYRGRIYWPLPSTAFSTTTNAVTAAYSALMLAATTALCPTTGLVLTTGGTTKIMPVLYNRKNSLVTAITAYVNDASFGTQKKGGAFGRPNTSPI
jgi:hypothetical protein